MGTALASIALEGCPQEDLEDRERLKETAFLLLTSVLSFSGYTSAWALISDISRTVSQNIAHVQNKILVIASSDQAQ